MIVSPASIVTPVRSSVDDEIPLVEAFSRSLVAGLTAGYSVTLRLFEVDRTGTPGASDKLLRSWPSMAHSVTTEVKAGTLFIKIRVVDPLTYLSQQPIWGAYQDESAAQIFGGALSLAAGGDGTPTLQPTLGGMPDVRIVPHLRTELANIPYAIACGEPLDHWLQRLLARLGIRIEMEVSSEGAILIHLRDGDPSDDPIAIKFEADGVMSATNAYLNELSTWPTPVERSVLLDNPATGDARQLGLQKDGTVRDVFFAAALDADEAGHRAEFEPDRWLAGQTDLSVNTQQSQARPERRLEFTNMTVDDAHVWQAADVLHEYVSGTYENTVWLQKGSMAWRPNIPRDTGPLVVSGVVDDGESERGAPVERDRLGRIPVRLAILPHVEDDDDSGASGSATAAATIISLPVLDLMGGGMHGFLPAHRQGDVCRVFVHQPLFAEVQGFCYRDDRRIGVEQTDVSTGFVAHRGVSNWAGLLFRPLEDLEEAYAEDDDS